MKPGPRRAAEISGAVKYKSQKACPQGHNSERYTYNGYCVECAALSVKNRADKIAASHAAQRADPEGYKRWLATKAKYRRNRYGHPEPTRPQPGYCECCKRTEAGGAGGWHLDHDHKTGEFRGWLCWGCNSAIGRLGDTVEGVQRALDYLNGIR